MSNLLETMTDINALFGVDIRIAILKDELVVSETEDPLIHEYIERRINELEPHKHRHVRPFNGNPAGSE